MALMSGRAAKAAIYPDDFCRTMMRAVDTWIKSLDSPTNALNGFLRDDLCDPEDYNYDNDYGGHKEAGYYWDDVKDGRLDSKLAKAARAEELEVFRKRKVYDIVPRASIPRGGEVDQCPMGRNGQGDERSAESSE